MFVWQTKIVGSPASISESKESSPGKIVGKMPDGKCQKFNCDIISDGFKVDAWTVEVRAFKDKIYVPGSKLSSDPNIKDKILSFDIEDLRYLMKINNPDKPTMEDLVHVALTYAGYHGNFEGGKIDAITKAGKTMTLPQHDGGAR